MKNPTYPGKILLIDDDQDARAIYGEFLTQSGFIVEFAVDGEEGLIKILDGGYDLILLDIMMPKIDGLSILKKLQERPQSVYNGPIVVLSALDQEVVIKQALELGAKGYLPKANFNPKQALDKIAEFMQNSASSNA